MKDNLVNYSFLSYFVLTVLGALMKLNHLEYSQIVMTIGICALALFMILTIMEINGSTKIDGTEKFMWTIGMLFLSFFAGIVYIFSARKRIV